MRRHLDTLRAQPHHVRKQVAFGTSAVITFFIFMFWLSSGSAPKEKMVAVESPDSAKTAGPLTASVVGAWDSIVSLRKDISSAFSPHTYTAPPVVVEVVPTDGSSESKNK